MYNSIKTYDKLINIFNISISEKRKALQYEKKIFDIFFDLFLIYLINI